MQVLKREIKLCHCCMEEHEVLTVKTHKDVMLKGFPIEYDAVYEYCDNSDSFLETEEMMTANYRAMQEAYHNLFNGSFSI